jgi:predicted deacylase
MAATAKTYPIELVAPDISAYKRGNSGVEYITTFDSGVAGPHVMVNAITHGNEICGAIAVDRLFKMNVRPVRGKLSLSFANVDAYHRWDTTLPHANRYVDEDFNRVWSSAVLDGTRDSVECRRARAMRPVIDDVDLLLDIHSMHDPHAPVMLSGALDKGIQLAQAVGVPEFIVCDRGHANGTRLRDYGGFSDPASTKNALLVECGQHWALDSVTVAWQTVWRFIRESACVNRDVANAEIDALPPAVTKVVRVTDALVAKTDQYRFREGTRGMDVIAHQGEVFAYDDGVPIAAPYDNCVLIMPTLVHVKPGLTVVRIGRLSDH